MRLRGFEELDWVREYVCLDLHSFLFLDGVERGYSSEYRTLSSLLIDLRLPRWPSTCRIRRHHSITTAEVSREEGHSRCCSALPSFHNHRFISFTGLSALLPGLTYKKPFRFIHS